MPVTFRLIGTVAFCCAVSFASPALAQVNLSGLVKDKATALPITGATVQIATLQLSTTTDANGRFTLTGTSSLQASLSPISAPLTSASRLAFAQVEAGPAQVRIFNLAGVEQALVFSGILPRGIWEVKPPHLAPGLYLCTFEVSGSRRFSRFLVSSQPSDRVTGLIPSSKASSDFTAMAKTATKSQTLDTLSVTRQGYRKVSLPLTTFQQSNLEILLDADSAGVNLEDATLIPDPSWTCMMPGGIPPPTLGAAAFSITLQIGAVRHVGRTPYGQRRQYDIGGGTVTGTRITANILAGGLDYELMLSNGSMEVEQILILRAGSTPILMRNAGVAPSGAKNARMVLDFEAPNSSSYAWLNTGKFAASRRVDTVAKTITLDVFDIAAVALPAKRIQIQDPPDSRHQTWECFQMTGSQGSVVFTENVTLGTSISIGASKRGNRNIIPITGGTTTGRVVGKILNGGADYQLSGLDARYTLAPNDGEYIIVRNCGAGALIPVFEARADGPYAFLNENKYLSSAPNVGSGGVSITFYEKR